MLGLAMSISRSQPSRGFAWLSLVGAMLLPGRTYADDTATASDKVDQIVSLLNDPQVQALLKSQSAAIPDVAGPDANPFAMLLSATRMHLHDVAAAAAAAPQTLSGVFSELSLRFGGWNLPLAILFVALVFAAAYAARTWATRALTGTLGREAARVLPLDRILSGALPSVAALFAALVAYLVLPWPDGIEPLVQQWVVAGVAFVLLGQLCHAYRTAHAGSAEVNHWCGYILRFMLVFLSGWALYVTLAELGASQNFNLLVAYLFGIGMIGVASRAVWTRPQSGALLGRRLPINLGFTIAFMLLGAFWVADMHVTLWVGIYLLLLPIVLPLITRIVRDSFVTAANADVASQVDGAEPAVVTRQTPTIQAVIVDRAARLVVMVVAMAWLTMVLDAHAQRFMQLGVFTQLLTGLFQGVIILLAADFLWQVLRAAIVRREAEAMAASTNVEIVARNNRLRTLLPILRTTLAVLIGTIAILMVLSGLGVEIGPLIAGAGIFGVAIGFGSQTLVKDIIAGVFYLLDDAFRVGEYIQSGSYKGVVEGFSLRSVRLRHHRGPVYTVPFGSLGAVQNMSRDWGKDKFLITVPFDTDLEVVRRLAKKIGLTIMEDPELGPAIIEPVKLKGIEQVADNGLVLGFGMMFRPTGQQTMIRRKAYAMLRDAFAANAIEFAMPTVSVTERDDEAAAAASAAKVIADRKAAEMAASGG